jgi:hypothetical protein
MMIVRRAIQELFPSRLRVRNAQHLAGGQTWACIHRRSYTSRGLLTPGLVRCAIGSSDRRISSGAIQIFLLDCSKPECRFFLYVHRHAILLDVISLSPGYLSYRVLGLLEPPEWSPILLDQLPELPDKGKMSGKF